MAYFDNENLKEGDEVAIFTDYGKKVKKVIITEVGRYHLNFDDGSTISSFASGPAPHIISTQDPLYKNTEAKFSAYLAIDVLTAEDAITHPEIREALEKCLDLIGKEEVELRHGRLISMGASTTKEQYIFRKTR